MGEWAGMEIPNWFGKINVFLWLLSFLVGIVGFTIDISINKESRLRKYGLFLLLTIYLFSFIYFWILVKK